MINATINFIGPVTYHNKTLSNLRLFGLDLAVYKEKVGNEVITQDCRVLCLFDNENPRWNDYRLPYLNRYIHVSGKTIGFYEMERRRCLCILITDLSFLSPAANVLSPSLAPPTTPSPTPQNGPELGETSRKCHEASTDRHCSERAISVGTVARSDKLCFSVTDRGNGQRYTNLGGGISETPTVYKTEKA
jgi:hypothetical protein